MVRDKFEPQLRRLLEPGFRTDSAHHMRHSGINTSGPTSCYTIEAWMDRKFLPAALRMPNLLAGGWQSIAPLGLRSR